LELQTARACSLIWRTAFIQEYITLNNIDRGSTSYSENAGGYKLPWVGISFSGRKEKKKENFFKIALLKRWKSRKYEPTYPKKKRSTRGSFR